MAVLDRLRALPWYSQAFIFALVAAGLVLAGQTLGVSPVKQALDEQKRLAVRLDKLKQEVSGLQAAEQQRQELRTTLQSLQQQLAIQRLVVPDEKQTDDFMRTLQGAAINARVSVRRLTAGAVVIKELYAEMPFEVELDGPYYNMMEFFQRLGDSERIVNAASLRLEGIDPARGQFNYTPGTTVAGVCTVTTYYRPSEAEQAAVAPPGQAAGGRPATASPPR